jgi:oligopeptide/dipeptide ABC transporter ATP-binding protein
MLSVHDLSVVFDTAAGPLRAVENLSLHLEEGETLGLVGESGSGKTMSALAVLGLVPRPGRIETGRVFFQERNILRASEPELRKLRGRALSMVFQDPLASLHPLLSIGRQLSEVLEVHEQLSAGEARRRAATALGEVGIPAPEESLARFPHELSGGMCQRVMIAMALLLRPKVLFADEPTSALDVTIQAQILELMKDLQRRYGMGIVLITHDFGVVAGMADRVQVMYAARVVESAETRALFRRPLHPYTRALLASIPRIPRAPGLHGEGAPVLSSIGGQPPDPLARPGGCAFHPRCGFVQERCRREAPELEELVLPGESARRSACFEARTLLRERGAERGS